MGWSYDLKLDTDRDRIRFLIGDTNLSEQLLQDEEIDWIMTLGGNLQSWAAMAARSIGASFARLSDTEAAEDVRSMLSQKSKQYFKLAEEILKDPVLSDEFGAGHFVEFYAGGQSKAEKTSDEADTDLVGPHITAGIHDRST